jgi:hypothetical protein
LKKSEEQYRVRQFKDMSLNFWVNYLHYTILDGKLFLAAGGIETPESREAIEKYLKRRKIEFK